jgi:hypothetical protein
MSKMLSAQLKPRTALHSTVHRDISMLQFLTKIRLSQKHKLFPTGFQFVPTYEVEFLVGHKLEFLSHKVHAHFIHNWYLAHLKMTETTKNTRFIHNSCLAHS